MMSKYNVEIDNNVIDFNLKRLINQTYKLLPNREEGIDWETPLATITEEIAGMAAIFDENLGSDILSLLCKLEGLKSLEQDDFFSFRRTIFECLNLLNKVKKYVESR